MSLVFAYLADHPELTSLLATWFFAKWGRNNPDLTVDVMETAVKERLNRDKAPLCLLAFLDGQPVATTAIKIREMETHPQYEHWLGNVYVLPEYRGQGIGSNLIQYTKNGAKRIGIRNLYLCIPVIGKHCINDWAGKSSNSHNIGTEKLSSWCSS